MTKSYTWEGRVSCNDMMNFFPKQLLLRDCLGNKSAGGVDHFFISSFFFPSFSFSPFPVCINLSLSQSTSFFLSFAPPILSPNPHCCGISFTASEWAYLSAVSSHHKPAAQSKSWMFLRFHWTKHWITQSDFGADLALSRR